MTAGGPVITRQIAILIDGGFFLRRVEALGLAPRNGDVEQIATLIRRQPSSLVAKVSRSSSIRYGSNDVSTTFGNISTDCSQGFQIQTRERVARGG